MQFSPSLDEASLTFRQSAPDQFHRIDGEDSDFALVVSMKMSQMVRRSWFREHADDDPKKPAKFRHTSILTKQSPEVRSVWSVLSQLARAGLFEGQQPVITPPIPPPNYDKR